MLTFKVSIPGGRIGRFLAGAAVASLIGGTAVAITSPDFTYSTTKNGYFTIDPMALAPSGAAATNNYEVIWISAQGAYLRLSSTPPAQTHCFQTGVHLPQGATVVSVTTWFSSNGTSFNDLAVTLLRHNLAGGTNALVNQLIVENSGVRKNITHVVPVNLRVVNNASWSYGYGLCMGAVGTNFYGARVNYTYRSAGD